MPRKSPYIDPVPPVRVGPMSNAAKALLMEIYFYNYISYDRLGPAAKSALMELQAQGLAHLSKQGDPTCNQKYPETVRQGIKPNCKFVVLDQKGYRYAHWIEVQTTMRRPNVVPNASGLARLGFDPFHY